MADWLVRYYPHGGGSLIDTFLHSVVASIGWMAGRVIGSLLGPVGLLILVAVVGLVYLVRHVRRPRRRGNRSRR